MDSSLWDTQFHLSPYIIHHILYMMSVYTERFGAMEPITFLIGFYVTQVVNRWWDQFMTLPLPDYLAIKLVNFCPGTVSEQVGYF